MIINLETSVKTRVIDSATKKVLSESPWQKNLILDRGLNALAGSTDSCKMGLFTATCRIGSGTTPNSYASGAVTFTQAATTITASAGFFTGAMVGMLFKYGSGSGGAEYYITGYTDSTHVTVDTSATVGTPEVATVWAVNQTTLATFAYNNTSYETSAGSCSTVFAGNLMTMKRTYNFATQAAPYNVNEIGYFNQTGGAGVIFGRLVLGSTDVVPPTSFYQVVLSVAVTFSPGVPTAVADVGTNINTAGNAMLECIETGNFISSVGTNGAIANGTNSNFDYSGNNPIFGLITANYSQNGTPQATYLTTTAVSVSSSVGWAYAGTRGKRTLTYNTTITTAGQTLYGLSLGLQGGANQCIFDVKLTSTYALPTGSFLPQAVWSMTFNRTLTN